MIIPADKEKTFIAAQRVARMATADKSGKPLVHPICYAYKDGNLYTPIDKKPKRVSGKELKRVKNIMENPNVSVVIDEYDEDWGKLRYTIIHGRAELMESGDEYEESLRLLCDKYPQYEKMDLSRLGLPVIKIVPQRIVSWNMARNS
jgi:PPOX class probable F420-dependent enzyme